MILVTLAAVWVGTIQRERHYAAKVAEIPDELARRRIRFKVAPGRFAKTRKWIGDEITTDIVEVEAHGFNGGPFDKDFELFKELRGLKSVNFDHTIISNAALQHISHLHLAHISLMATKVDDGSMTHLAKMSRLRDLNLSCTRVSDKSVEALLKMQSLQKLDVSYTLISKNGADKLSKSLPNCEVVWEKR